MEGIWIGFGGEFVLLSLSLLWNKHLLLFMHCMSYRSVEQRIFPVSLVNV